MFQAENLPPLVLERIADRFRLLGDPSRLKMVRAMHVDGELTVGDLVERVDLSYSSVSKQLSMLKARGMIARRRDGANVYYRIDDPSLAELCEVACRGVQSDWERTAVALDLPRS